MPVSPPLTVKESDGSVSVRPTNVLSFNAADFSVSGSGDTATISIDSTGTGAALTDTYVGYGDGSNLLTGSSKFTYSAASELLTLTCSDNTDTLVIKSTDTDANVGPIFTLFRDDGATPTANDVLGRVMFKADNSVTATTTYAEITGICNSPTDGAEHGWMNLGVMTNGTVDTDYITLRGDAAQVCVNEGAADIDFRIEGGAGNPNLFRTNAGLNNIGIGGAPESTKLLHIIDDGTKAITLSVESTDGDANVGPVIQFNRNSGSPADGDSLGALYWSFDDDGGGSNDAGYIKAYISDATAGSEDGDFYWYALNNGSQYNMLSVRGGIRAVEVNVNNADVDFIANGDTVTELLHVDASQDNIGIGTSPDSDVERLHILGDGVGDDIVRIQTDDDGSASGPHIQVYRNSATPQDGDDLGEIFFAGNHAATSGGSSAGKENYARIRSECPDVQSSAESGRLLFDVATNGSLIEFVRMTSSGSSGYIVFNEASNNIDFRVESNNNGNMFKVDAGLDIVSVGSTATSGGATFQVPNNTISSYCNLGAVRSDATAQQNMTNDDCQGKTWVNNSSTAWTILLPEGGLKGQWFHLVSTDGNWTITCQVGDTLNGVAGSTSVTRSVNNAIYTVICIENNTWIVDNSN